MRQGQQGQQVWRQKLGLEVEVELNQGLHKRM